MMFYDRTLSLSPPEYLLDPKAVYQQTLFLLKSSDELPQETRETIDELSAEPDLLKAIVDSIREGLWAEYEQKAKENIAQPGQNISSDMPIHIVDPQPAKRSKHLLHEMLEETILDVHTPLQEIEDEPDFEDFIKNEEVGRKLLLTLICTDGFAIPEVGERLSFLLKHANWGSKPFWLTQDLLDQACFLGEECSATILDILAMHLQSVADDYVKGFHTGANSRFSVEDLRSHLYQMGNIKKAYEAYSERMGQDFKLKEDITAKLPQRYSRLFSNMLEAINAFVFDSDDSLDASELFSLFELIRLFDPSVFGQAFTDALNLEKYDKKYDDLFDKMLLFNQLSLLLEGIEGEEANRLIKRAHRYFIEARDTFEQIDASYWDSSSLSLKIFYLTEVQSQIGRILASMQEVEELGVNIRFLKEVVSKKISALQPFLHNLHAELENIAPSELDSIGGFSAERFKHLFCTFGFEAAYRDLSKVGSLLKALKPLPSSALLTADLLPEPDYSGDQQALLESMIGEILDDSPNKMEDEPLSASDATTLLPAYDSARLLPPIPTQKPTSDGKFLWPEDVQKISKKWS